MNLIIANDRIYDVDKMSYIEEVNETENMMWFKVVLDGRELIFTLKDHYVTTHVTDNGNVYLGHLTIKELRQAFFCAKCQISQKSFEEKS